MRDSHGLFDYESRNISKKNLKTKYVGKIIRQSNTIEFISPNTAIEDLPGYKKDEILTLAQIKQDNSKFRVFAHPRTHFFLNSYICPSV